MAASGGIVVQLDSSGDGAGAMLLKLVVLVAGWISVDGRSKAARIVVGEKVGKARESPREK